MISNHGDYFGRFIPIIENRLDGCLGNHAFLHSAIMFEDKSILHYMDNEQFDSHEKTVPVCRGG